MRVIAGDARSRKLKELPGMETRPTTDKVKESLFNIIQFEIEGRRVLDLFGGTGQLGIEALSRGAESCTFVDQRREAVAVIRENVALCGYGNRARILQGDSIAFLATCREPFDLIFLDPPYQTDLLEQSIHKIISFDILRENGIIICESPADRPMPPAEAPYRWGKDYRYGKIKLTLCRRLRARDR